MAHRTRFEFDLANQYLTEAADEALAAGFTQLGGRALLSLSGSYSLAGNLETAIEMAGRAAEHLEGADLLATQVQLGAFNSMRGEFAEALARYDAALDGFANLDAGVERLPLLYGNRAVALMNLGRFAEAQTSLIRAWELIDHDPSQSGQILSHLGRVTALRGDLPGAMAWFEMLAGGQHPGGDDPGWRLDYAMTLSAAGLYGPARQAAGAAAEKAEAAGLTPRLVDAHLAIGGAQAAVGEFDAALASSEVAAQHLAALGADRHRADLLKVRCLIRQGTESSLQSAAILNEVINRDHETRDPGLAFEMAIGFARLGDTARAASWLHQGDAHGELSTGEEVLSQTAAAWLAVANGDDVRGHQLAVEAARGAYAHRRNLGATELQAASPHGLDATRLGLAIALRQSNATEAFRWAETFRAVAQQPRPARTEHDSDLAAEYRQAAAQLNSGNAGPDGRRKLADLERALAEKARSANAAPAELSRADPTSVSDELFVEFIQSDTDWWAIVVSGGDVRLEALPEAGNVRRRLDALDLAVDRLRHRPGADAALYRTLEDLGRRLVEPWFRSEGRIVLSPVGLLSAVPWAALPALRHSAVTVTPSARLWARDRRPTGTGTALVAGPGLAHAEQEVQTLAAHYGGATVLAGDRASVDAVLDQMDRVDLLHVAAHGNLRTDNPLFCSLTLADGPLNVYDIETRQAPRRVVLSACSVGSTVEVTAANSLGLATSFLSMGSSEVVASLFEVDDRATLEVMTMVHEHLSEAGDSASALMETRARLSGSALVAALSFQAYG